MLTDFLALKKFSLEEQLLSGGQWSNQSRCICPRESNSSAVTIYSIIPFFASISPLSLPFILVPSIHSAVNLLQAVDTNLYEHTCGNNIFSLSQNCILLIMNYIPTAFHKLGNLNNVILLCQLPNCPIFHLWPSAKKNCPKV